MTVVHDAHQLVVVNNPFFFLLSFVVFLTGRVVQPHFTLMTILSLKLFFSYSTNITQPPDWPVDIKIRKFKSTSRNGQDSSCWPTDRKWPIKSGLVLGHWKKWRYASCDQINSMLIQLSIIIFKATWGENASAFCCTVTNSGGHSRRQRRLEKKEIK